MATTIAEVAENVFRRISPTASEELGTLNLADIKAWIPTACTNLAEMALETHREFQEYLTKTYTITAVAGVFPLTAATDLLYESVPHATVTHPDSDWPLEYIPDPADLYYPLPDVYIHYAMDRSGTARILRTQDTAGDLDTLTGDITIRNGIFVPVVAALAGSTTLPDQLNDELIELLIQMATAKMGTQPPAQSVLG